MSNLANLYIRTPLGRVTAFNPGAKLPAPAKALLKAVDGKTTTGILLAAYTDLGDVASLLAILQSSGLIVDRNEDAAKSSMDPATPTSTVAPTVVPTDNQPWVNSDNALLDSSFGDFGTSVFSQFPIKKP
jgi:hypothetical protein